MTDPGIAPGLLLAMPQLPDPVFARSVVFVIEHNERGAFGLLLNRPTDIPLGEAIHQVGLPWPEPSDQVIWNGGPVLPGPQEPYGYILHHPAIAASDNDKPDDSSRDFRLYPFPPQDDLLELLMTEQPERLRFFMGYSAWAPGQLESELRTDAWLMAPADPVIVFGTRGESMWESAIRSLGVEPSSIVPSSGVH